MQRHNIVHMPIRTAVGVHETVTVVALVLASPGGSYMVVPCRAVTPAPVVCAKSVEKSAPYV